MEGGGGGGGIEQNSRLHGLGCTILQIFHLLGVYEVSSEKIWIDMHVGPMVDLYFFGPFFFVKP